MNGWYLCTALLLASCGSSTWNGSNASSSPSASAAAPVQATQKAAAIAIPVQDGEVLFRVELATTPSERARGLMYREHLNADDGMLFLFDRMQQQSFWMKNTLIPLDMIFIDERGAIVGIVENAEPLSTTSRSVRAPSKYVLELNGGTCRKLGIQVGALTRFVDVPGHPQPDAP